MMHGEINMFLQELSLLKSTNLKKVMTKKNPLKKNDWILYYV